MQPHDASSDRFTLVPGSRLARRAGLGLAAMTAAVIVVFLLVFTLHRLVPIGNGNWRRIVDVGGESNVPTWWNATLLAGVAITACGAAAVTRPDDRTLRRSWLVVAAAATYLSVDEHATLHERLAYPVRRLDIELPTFAWLLPGSILAGLGAALLVMAGRHLPRPLAGRLGVALALYALGAIGMEAFNGLIRGDGDASLLYTLGLTVEESLEMLACVYALAAIVDAHSCRRTETGVLLEPR